MTSLESNIDRSYRKLKSKQSILILRSKELITSNRIWDIIILQHFHQIFCGIENANDVILLAMCMLC
jgi:hypothetical protein